MGKDGMGGGFGGPSEYETEYIYVRDLSKFTIEELEKEIESRKLAIIKGENK